MTWQDILMIIAPLMSLMGWTYFRIDKKFDIVMSEIKEMRKDIQSLDSRISRIEGQLTPRYWEPKVKGEEK